MCIEILIIIFSNVKTSQKNFRASVIGSQPNHNNKKLAVLDTISDLCYNFFDNI